MALFILELVALSGLLALAVETLDRKVGLATIEVRAKVAR